MTKFRPSHTDNDLPSDLYVITEQWENQYDHYVHNTVNAESNIVTAAIKAQKAKFRFPKHDPSAPDIVDTRSDEEKMQDILRVWSQVLTPAETAIWNEVSQRDLSKDISLKSGLRTPKCVIDREIKQFKLAAGKKAAMFQTLKNLPDHFLPAPTSQTELIDSSDILETKPTL